MNELDKILGVLNQASEQGDFDNLNSYEESESYEIENYIVRAQSMPRFQASKMARAIVKNPVLYAKTKAVMNANAGTGMMNIQSGGDQPVASAQFDITVTRQTALIPFSLPIVIFGMQDAQNGYRQIISNLPVGVTLTSVRFGENASQPNAVRFKFTSGVNEDNIDVVCNQYPYPAFLQSQNVDLLRLSKLRYSISDPTQIAQFNEEHKIVQRSMFGKSTDNSMSIGAYKRPDQFQAGIIDVDGTFEIDKETGIKMGVIAVAGFSITYSMFVQKFFRQTAKGF